MKEVDNDLIEAGLHERKALLLGFQEVYEAGNCTDEYLKTQYTLDELEWVELGIVQELDFMMEQLGNEEVAVKKTGLFILRRQVSEIIKSKKP